MICSYTLPNPIRTIMVLNHINRQRGAPATTATTHLFIYISFCLSQFVGVKAHDLTVAHYYQVAIISASTLDKATLRQKDTRIYSLLKFSYLKLTHSSIFSDTLTGQRPLLFRSSSHKQSSLHPRRCYYHR